MVYSSSDIIVVDDCAQLSRSLFTDRDNGKLILFDSSRGDGWYCELAIRQSRFREGACKLKVGSMQLPCDVNVCVFFDGESVGHASLRRHDSDL